MVLPVSGFLPVPLPMMIPFMGAQSLVIGKMFGEGFQYGKRKISAMPNEEFNKLTFEAMMSNARDELQASIPTMIQAMQDMKPMVAAVIHEFTNYLSLVIQNAPSQAEEIISTAAHTLAPHDKVQIPQGHTEELDIFGTIAEQFPHAHEAGATDLGIPLTSQTFTTGGTAKIDTSGMTLAQHKQNLRDKAEKLRLARLHRPKQLQQFGSTLIKPQVSKTVTKRAAGQSAKMERLRLIKEIARLGKLITGAQGQLSSSFQSSQSKNRYKTVIQQSTIKLKRQQQLLVNLLARYRF